MRRFRSPERPYRVALFLVLAVVSGTQAARAGGGIQAVLIAAAGLLFAVLAWRAAKVEIVSTESALEDVRLFKRKAYDWAQISSLEIGRPSGPWGGHCLMAVLTDGQEVPLLGYRVYALLPAKSHLERLQKTLTEVRNSGPGL